MSSSSPTPKQTGSGTAKAGKSTPKVNRSQIRAMESRAASTPIEQFSLTAEEAAAISSTRSGASAISRKKPAARTYFLSRAQEYAYIRSDMRRLVITASGLLVLMIILLVILD